MSYNKFVESIYSMEYEYVDLTKVDTEIRKDISCDISTAVEVFEIEFFNQWRISR